MLPSLLSSHCAVRIAQPSLRLVSCVQYFAETSFRVANKQRDEASLREKIDVFLDLVQDDDREALRAFVSYLTNIFENTLSDEDIEQINNPLKVKEGIMNLAERVEQKYLRRIEQGRKEGIEEGMQEGRKETARNMLAKGLSEELVRDITGLSEEEIRDLKQ